MSGPARNANAGGGALTFGKADPMRTRVGGRPAYAFSKRFPAFTGLDGNAGSAAGRGRP